MIFEIGTSKFNALEKIILILDQTIRGRQKRIYAVYSPTAENSSPKRNTNILPAVPFKGKNITGIIKDNITILLNLFLISMTSVLVIVFESSGKRISKLAAAN